MVFDSLKRFVSGPEGDKGARLRAELARVEEAIEKRRQQLEEKRHSRLESLFPEGPVEGFGPRHYPDMDPLNLEADEEESWLVAVATRIIDNFPGSASLLSQLDNTLRAFSDANHYRVETPDGPWGELLGWRDEDLAAWGLAGLEVPIYVSSGSTCAVQGCKEPFALFGRSTLSDLEEPERRFVVAATLGHVFFGNLKIFAFHKLMEILDKLPSMSGLITRGIRMIPIVGTTISGGIELARTMNNQVIRKTNLVVGLRQHLLCDRLAVLALGDDAPAQRYFAHQVLGKKQAGEDGVRERLIAQGRRLYERFEKGEVDLHMLSVVGPTASFAAFRAYKLDAWLKGENYQRITSGYYVTRTRVQEYEKAHHSIDQEIKYLQARILELHEKETKLAQELAALEAEQAEAQTRSADVPGPDEPPPHP